jgi:hypothetical protein
LADQGAEEGEGEVDEQAGYLDPPGSQQAVAAPVSKASPAAAAPVVIPSSTFSSDDEIRIVIHLPWPTSVLKAVPDILLHLAHFASEHYRQQIENQMSDRRYQPV